MRIVTALLTILITSSALAQAWPSPRRGYESTSLAGDRLDQPFVRWSDGILIDNVMVNGKGPYRFLLDTGAEGAGRIDRSVVEALTLPLVGEAVSRGILGQQIDMSEHRIESLSIGGLSFSNVVMMSRDYSDLGGPGLRPVHGILGYHLFNEYLLTINYPARMVSVERGELQAANNETVFNIISDDEDPEIEVLIGGRKAQALLDTGAMNHLAVPSEFAGDLRFLQEPVVRGRQEGAEIRVGDLDGEIRIGALGFTNPQTYIAPPLVQPIIGVRILAQLSMTFDQKNGRVRLDMPPARPRYGFGLAWRGQGPYQFVGVDENGIAARAGLLASDRIVSINERAFAEIDREDMMRMLDAENLRMVVDRDGQAIELRMSLR